MTMFEPAVETVATSKRPQVEAVYWRDLDLSGWGEIDYSPNPYSAYGPVSINDADRRFDLNNSVYSLVGVADASVFRVVDDVLFPTRARPGTLTSKVDRADSRMRRSDRAWVAQGSKALNFSEVALGDYSLYSLGNLQRVSGAVDWVQGRSDAVADRVGGPGKSRPVSAADRAVDIGQEGFWEAYRFGQRLIIQTLDETILNGIENTVDQAINSISQEPAEIVVD